jgi:glycosyltransferase involved in cell wall biosynthesis
MKVAIIIGTYNNQSHIADTIASVRSQSLSDWKAIVIDNGSSDESSNIAKKKIFGDPRFEFLQKENEGPSAFRNLGFSIIGKDCAYTHFLDGDDVLNKEFLKTLTNHLDTNPKAGVAACQFEVIDANGKFVSSGFRSRFAPGFLGFPRQLAAKEIVTPFETFFSATGQGPFAIFRSSIFAQTKGYEPDFWSHEDSDIFCQMALLAEVHYLPSRLYQKRTHGHNLTGSSRADYGKFRSKWDNYFCDDPDMNRKIDNAFRYYHGLHAPLRHFKISVKAFKEFLRNRTFRSLSWSWHMFKCGVCDLFFRKELTRRWSQREKLRLSRQSS